MNCEFLEPIYWNKEAQSFLPVEADGFLDLKDTTWAFSKINCGTLIENPINQDSNFRLLKQYSYGDITTIVLMGTILFFLVFLTLKKLFFHDTTRIHTISQKKF